MTQGNLNAVSTDTLYYCFAKLSLSNELSVPIDVGIIYTTTEGDGYVSLVPLLRAHNVLRMTFDPTEGFSLSGQRSYAIRCARGGNEARICIRVLLLQIQIKGLQGLLLNLKMV